MAEKLIADNRKARHEYELLDRVEAGIVLTGTEVKSLREGRATLAQAYADVRDGEAWLQGAEIAVYDQGNRANHEPTRPRKLLLHRREIDRLYGQVREKGLTLVPTRLYFKDGRVKVELALARGKNTYDKRRARRPRRQAPDRACFKATLSAGEPGGDLERCRRACAPEVEDAEPRRPDLLRPGKRRSDGARNHHGTPFAIWWRRRRHAGLLVAATRTFFVPPYVGTGLAVGSIGIDWDDRGDRRGPREIAPRARREPGSSTGPVHSKTYGGAMVSTWSILRQSCKPRSPVGLVKQPENKRKCGK